jgi:Chaperone of endosialidase
MGGKSSGAPAPDPALIAAQIKSMGIQDDAIQRIMANSESLMPLQREQMEFGLQTSRAAYDQSQQDREWMLGRRGMLTDTQDQLLKDAKDFNTEDRREQLAGQAIGDVNQAFGAAEQAQSRNLTRMGVNPNDGKFAAMSNQMTTAKALGQAQAANVTREAARKEGYALTDRASNALAGYPAMGMQATGAGAGYGGLGLSTANTALAGMNSGFGTGAQVAGQMGSNATNMWNAQANYKNSQDQIAASSDPFNTMLGAAAGVGTAWALKASDRRLKTDIQSVGLLANGLTVYRYRYKSGGPTHIGVMADEVAAIAPEAYVKGGAGDGFDAVDYSKLP